METDDDTTTQERDRLRRIVAALWHPHTEARSLSPTDARLASECVAWAIGQSELTTIEDAEQIANSIFSGETETETWRLIAHTMEAARDRAVATRSALLDVAAAAAVLLTSVEEAGDERRHVTEAHIVREALERFDKLRST